MYSADGANVVCVVLFVVGEGGIGDGRGSIRHLCTCEYASVGDAVMYETHRPQGLPRKCLGISLQRRAGALFGTPSIWPCGKSPPSLGETGTSDFTCGIPPGLRLTALLRLVSWGPDVESRSQCPLRRYVVGGLHGSGPLSDLVCNSKLRGLLRTQ